MTRRMQGEIGAGHTITAFYEVVPAQAKSLNGSQVSAAVDYEPTVAANSPEILTLQVRYKRPDAEQSQLMTFPLLNQETRFEETTLTSVLRPLCWIWNALASVTSPRQRHLPIDAGDCHCSCHLDSDGYRAPYCRSSVPPARLTNQP